MVQRYNFIGIFWKSIPFDYKIVNAAKAENMERFNSFDANRTNPEEEEKTGTPKSTQS